MILACCGMALQEARPAFEAWAGLVQQREDRFRDHILSEGQRRYFALRRRVNVWRRWLVERRRLQCVAIAVNVSVRRRAIMLCFKAVQHLSHYKRVLSRFCAAVSSAIQRRKLREWLRASFALRAACILDTVTRRSALRDAFSQWSIAAIRQLKLQTFSSTLASLFTRSLLRSSVAAFVRNSEREQQKIIAAAFIKRRSTPRRAIKKWRSFLHQRQCLQKIQTLVVALARRSRLFQVWKIWGRASLWEQRSRTNTYIAESHCTAQMTRRAFAALRAGVRASVAERPVLTTCARVLAAWCAHSVRRRHLKFGIFVAARRLLQLRVRHATRTWKSAANDQRARRDKLVLAMQHWRKQELRKGFALWSVFHVHAAHAAQLQANANEQCATLIGRRMLRLWHSQLQAVTLTRRADSFAATTLLSKCMHAWRWRHEADVAQKRLITRSTLHLRLARLTKTLSEWRSVILMHKKLTLATENVSKTRRLRHLRLIFPRWARAAAASKHEHDVGAKVRLQCEQRVLSRCMNIWATLAAEATGICAATITTVAARRRRDFLRCLGCWRHWSRVRRRARTQAAEANAAAAALLLGNAVRRAVMAWRDCSARHRIIRALSVRSRRMAQHRLANRAFSSLAAYALWRRRRNAAKHIADLCNSLRLLAGAWGGWRTAHSTLGFRCKQERRALEHWERTSLRRVFVSWKAWQQYRAALAKHWVQGTALRTALPKSSGGGYAGMVSGAASAIAPRNPPRGINSDVAAHLGKLELLAAGGRQNPLPEGNLTRDKQPFAAGIDSSSPSQPSYAPLLLLVEATQRLVHDTAAAARLEGDTPRGASKAGTGFDQPATQGPRQRLDASIAAALPASIRPRPRALDLADSANLASLPPERTDAPHAGARQNYEAMHTRLPLPASPAVTRSIELAPPRSRENTALRAAPTTPPSAVSKGGLAPAQLQALLAFWNTKAEELQQRGSIISQLDQRIATLELLLTSRRLRTAADTDLGDAKEAPASVDEDSMQLQTALQELSASRQSLASEQVEWSRALAVAQPRLAAAHIAGLSHAFLTS